MSGAPGTDRDTERQSIQVAVRVRPLNSRERAADEPIAVSVFDGGEVQVDIGRGKELRRFAFDYGYGADADQQRVHDDLGQTLLSNTVDGYNSCLFAYGQTGSGKSWTVLGDQQSRQQRGLLPRLCEGIFEHLSGNEMVQEYRVVCTYLEIYQEKMKDLLTPSPAPLEVRKHPLHGVYVPNLSEAVVRRYSDIQNLLQVGNANRAVSATVMNENSSRSHAVFTLNVTLTLKDQRQQQAHLHVVDLAGSERQKKTEAEGARLKEGASINQSLTVLGQVIFALAGQQAGRKGVQHVPFRNSKLTFLLSDSLSGNSKTVMIAAVSPTVSNFDETLNTLRFAQSVKKVKTQAFRNEAMSQDPAVIIEQLRQEIAQLKLLRLSAPVPQALPDPAEPAVLVRADAVDDDGFASERPVGGAAEQLEGIERGVALAGRPADREAMRSLASRLANLRELVEQANFIMSWLMEYDFIPRSEGESKWQAAVSWTISESSPHFQGTLQAQLVLTREDGSESLQIACGEDDFQEIVRGLEAKCEECTDELNSAVRLPQAAETPASASSATPAPTSTTAGSLPLAVPMQPSPTSPASAASPTTSSPSAVASIAVVNGGAAAATPGGQARSPSPAIHGSGSASCAGSPPSERRPPVPPVPDLPQADQSGELQRLQDENASLRAELAELRRKAPSRSEAKVDLQAAKADLQSPKAPTFSGYPSWGSRRLEVPVAGAGAERTPSPTAGAAARSTSSGALRRSSSSGALTRGAKPAAPFSSTRMRS